MNKLHLRLVPDPCDRFHLTTCGLNVINAAKALARARRNEATRIVKVWEKRLDLAVAALEKEERIEPTDAQIRRLTDGAR
jgi:hypothetical protein